MPNDFQADIDIINRIDHLPDMLAVICTMTGMRFSAVARVTEERWVACLVRDGIALGLEAGAELPVKSTLCDEVRQTRQPIIIDHVATDAIFASHHTPALYKFQSYISVPISLPDGEFFGVLCALDPAPCTVDTPAIRDLFRLLTNMIGSQIATRRHAATTETRLTEERAEAGLREQFVAILGHDLRNPLASVRSGMSLLQGTPLNDKAAMVVQHVHRSVNRMARLVDDMLDLARGRLGGGIKLAANSTGDLEAMIRQVVGEADAQEPARVIDATYRLAHPVLCDVNRIGQVCSNLLGNAITHGDPAQPVRLLAETTDTSFRLSVSNGGAAIPTAAMERLFQPFFRGEVRDGQQGLGLGLYISSEIAKAHGGLLSVMSDETATTITLEIPIGFATA